MKGRSPHSKYFYDKFVNMSVDTSIMKFEHERYICLGECEDGTIDEMLSNGRCHGTNKEKACPVGLQSFCHHY